MKYYTTQKLSLLLTTLGGIGYFPYAPGTLATAVSLGLLYLCSFFAYSWAVQLLCICLLTLLSLLTISLVMRSVYTEKDPSYIVIDEMVGTCVTFFCVPVSYWSLLLGFILFRFFDIYKPLGIRSAEQLPGAFGILADDILAGLYTVLILHCWCRLLL